MKKLSTTVAELINDFSIESDSNIRQYVFEKDLIVCDAIRALSQIPQDENFRLVFCGGTCLSKAYGLLQRMSEDVDFKIVPTKMGSQLSRSALKKHLGAYVKSVVEHLERCGFDGNCIARQCRDEYKYTSLDIQFESVFEKPVSLRPHLLIELNFTLIADKTEFKNAGSLFDSLSKLSNFTPVAIECVSLSEAFTEKLISFPRRLAMQIAKFHPNVNLTADTGWDPALVRHLYDVCVIANKSSIISNDISKIAGLLQLVIAKDANEFANQHPEFISDPKNELLSAIKWAKTSVDLKAQYQQFVDDMVYAPKSERPSFEASIDLFERTLSSALAALPDEIDTPSGYSYEAHDGLSGQESEARSLASIWNANPAGGTHGGIIKAMSETEVIQDIGRKQCVVWPRQYLSGKEFEVGEYVTINANGVVQIPRPRDSGLTP